MNFNIIKNIKINTIEFIIILILITSISTQLISLYFEKSQSETEQEFRSLIFKDVKELVHKNYDQICKNKIK